MRWPPRLDLCSLGSGPSNAAFRNPMPLGSAQTSGARLLTLGPACRFVVQRLTAQPRSPPRPRPLGRLGWL